MGGETHPSLKVDSASRKALLWAGRPTPLFPRIHHVLVQELRGLRGFNRSKFAPLAQGGKASLFGERSSTTFRFKVIHLDKIAGTGGGGFAAHRAFDGGSADAPVVH